MARVTAAALAVLAAALLLAPVASAHELREERAESAVERYARTVAGGSTGTLSVSGSGGETTIQVTRYDAGRCRARGIHVRVCPLVYEGEDYLEEACQDEPLLADPNPTQDTKDCFTEVVCRQTVTVTLRGHGTAAAPRTPAPRSSGDDDLSLRATNISCDFDGNAPAPSATPTAPGPAPTP